MSVKRYDPDCDMGGFNGMAENEDGDYVLYTNYAALKAKADAMAALLEDSLGYDPHDREGPHGEDWHSSECDYCKEVTAILADYRKGE